METLGESTMDIDECNQTAEEDGNFHILTANEKKKWIKKYRGVYDNLREVDLNEEEVSELVKKMEVNVIGQNEILEKVGVNEMITHDAKCISMSSHMSYNLVKKFNTECKFDKRDFLVRLRQRVLSNSRKAGMSSQSETSSNRWIHFEQLFGTGLAFSGIHHQVPAVPQSFLSPEKQPEKRTVVRTQNKTQGTATQATKYESSNLANEEDESEKRLRQIHRKLRKLQKRNSPTGTPLIQSAVNPDSFSTTVENFFNIAFLARQKMVKIDVPEDPNDIEPIVKAFQDPNNKSDTVVNDAEEIEQDKERPPIQSVFTFDYETYEALINNLEITRAAFK